MNRTIYRKSVAPHNQRVAADVGIPTDRVDKFIELMNFYEARKGVIKLLANPHLTGNKVRTSGNLRFCSKLYSANSVNQELGAELIPFDNGTFSIDNDPYWTKVNGATINNGNANLSNSISSAAGIKRAGVCLTGKRYKVTVQINNYLAGALHFADDNAVAMIVANANGKFTFEYTATNSTVYFFGGNTSVNLSIDNISIREILSNDLTQSTSTSQPYTTGGIAPTETLGIENPNGGSNSLTHPTISFGANDAWSVTTVLNWNGELITNINNSIFGSWDGLRFGLRINSNNRFLLFKSNGSTEGASNGTNKLLGKLKIVTLIYSNGTILIYVDGILSETLNNSFAAKFDSLFRGWFDNTSSTAIKHHVITSHAPSAQEVLQEATLLKALYPDIESVRIGEQIWATSNCKMAATPMGNVIPEVQSAATWATSQTLYDNAYAATSGTVEQKTYAAVKAAAMWCHYNNSVDNGATYGKLYNWFAVKLLQMDIDYYNAQNPTALWGWRVPTQADFQTLSTYLGGDSVSGGKLKKEGLTYWSSPNTGATNESGFSAIGCGYRLSNGDFSGINVNGVFYTINLNGTYPYRAYVNNNNAILNIDYAGASIHGHSLRLIRS